MSGRRRDNDAYYWERRGTSTTADVADLGAIYWPALGESEPVVAVVNGDSEQRAPVVNVGAQREPPAVAVCDGEAALDDDGRNYHPGGRGRCAACTLEGDDRDY